MIKDLAEFENYLKEVEIDEDTLNKDCFEENLYGFFVAKNNDDEIIGYALYIGSWTLILRLQDKEKMSIFKPL